MSCLVFASSPETARMHAQNIDRDRYGEIEIVADREQVLSKLASTDRPMWASVNGAMMPATEAYDYLSATG